MKNETQTTTTDMLIVVAVIALLSVVFAGHARAENRSSVLEPGLPKAGDLEAFMKSLPAADGMRLTKVDFGFGGDTMMFDFQLSSGKPLSVLVVAPKRGDTAFGKRYGSSEYPPVCIAPTNRHFFFGEPEWFHIVQPGSEVEAKLLALVADAIAHAPTEHSGRADLIKLEALLKKRSTSWDAIHWEVIARERAKLEELKAEVSATPAIVFKNIQYYTDGGSIGFQFATTKGTDIWVIALNSLMRKTPDNVLWLAARGSFKAFDVIEEHGAVEAKLLNLVQKVVSELKPDDYRAREMNILVAILKNRKTGAAGLGRAALKAKYPPPVNHPLSPELAKRVKMFWFTPTPEMLADLKKHRISPSSVGLNCTVAQLPEATVLSQENINQVMPEILSSLDTAGVLSREKPSLLCIFSPVVNGQDRYEIVSYEQTDNACAVRIEHSYPKNAPKPAEPRIHLIVIPMGIVAA